LQTGLGRVDLLHDFLTRLHLATPEAVDRYLPTLHSDLERRPIADQIVDQILSENTSRYALYEEVRAARPSPDLSPSAIEPIAADVHEAMGEFLQAWIDFEQIVRETVPPKIALNSGKSVIPTIRVLESIAHLDSQTRLQYERLRRMRNHLVHGIETPDPADLREAAEQLRRIRAGLSARPNDGAA